VMAAAIGVFVLAWGDVQVPQNILSLDGALAIVSEAVIGLAMGFVLQMTFAAPVMAAEQISGTMGMAIATAVDPNTGMQSGALGQYFTVVLTLIFLAVGGHLLWLRLVIDSYSAFPPGGAWLGAERAREIVLFGGQMFATALAIALPVTLVLLLVQVVTGVISRSAPALNLFALGLPAGVLTGIAALIAAAPMITDQFTDLVATGLGQIDGLFLQ
jgi:flagellar biosynthesis protein FliR